MIDPIGLRGASAVERRSSISEAVEALKGTAPARTPQADQKAVAESGVRTMARELSSRPPVDHERVQQIRRAIEEGRFPIVPARIADRLIAASMEWARDDEG